MKNDSLFLLVAAAVAFYFISQKGGGSSTVVKSGSAAPFNAPQVPKSSAPAAAGPSLSSDIANYANTFKNITGTLSGLYSSYFGNSDSGLTDEEYFDIAGV